MIPYITAPNIQNAKPVSEPLLQERVDREVAAVVALAKQIKPHGVVHMPLAINRIQQGGTELTFCYVNDFHPNQVTAYLAANMFYGALFKKSTEGFGFDTVTEDNPKGKGKGKDPDGNDAKVVFSGETQTYLQKMAWQAVKTFERRVA